jgi:hypothetical protein
MKKASNLIDLSALDLDPAVQATINKGARLSSDRSLPKAERTRQAKEREKTSSRHRFNMDLDPSIDKRLASLANRDDVKCPASGLANLALHLFLDAVEAGAVDLRDYLAPSRSPRYERTIKLPSENADKSPPRGSP